MDDVQFKDLINHQEIDFNMKERAKIMIER